MLSWVTTKVLAWALVASLALGALTTSWQYLGRRAAEKAAQRADTARGEAVAQASVLSANLVAQNAAVAELGKKLASKQAEVRAAEAAAAKMARESQAKSEALAKTAVPSDCQGAFNWLHDQLEGAGQ